MRSLVLVHRYLRVKKITPRWQRSGKKKKDGRNTTAVFSVDTHRHTSTQAATSATNTSYEHGRVRTHGYNIIKATCHIGYTKAISCPLFFVINFIRPRIIVVGRAAQHTRSPRTRLVKWRVYTTRWRRQCRNGERRDSKRNWSLAVAAGEPTTYVVTAAAAAESPASGFPVRGHTAPLCSHPGKRRVIVRGAHARTPVHPFVCAPLHGTLWYHTRFWFVVISPDEFDECCVALCV